MSSRRLPAAGRAGRRGRRVGAHRRDHRPRHRDGARRGAAWLVARFTGRAARARTVALAALVGTQLGQTLLVGGRSPAVLAASAGSMAALAVVIQTPGVSHFFGCTPLGPVAWTLALTSAPAATIGSLFLPPVARRGRAALSG
jgi:cation-transporting P-type ATPase I